MRLTYIRKKKAACGLAIDDLAEVGRRSGGSRAEVGRKSGGE